MKLPGNFSDLYPNRFLHADQLKGRKVTVTVKDITMEELEGEKGKKLAVIFHFAESSKQLAVNKTNGFCMKRMFGNDPNAWVGKRVTIYPTTTPFGRQTVDCIRFWGSPDIAADMPITIPAGRKKPINAIMRKVNPGECGFKGTPNVTPINNLAHSAESFEVALEEEPEISGTAVIEEAFPDDAAITDFNHPDFVPDDVIA